MIEDAILAYPEAKKITDLPLKTLTFFSFWKVIELQSDHAFPDGAIIRLIKP